ncbi:putative transmembrane protein [Toxoplasma gondii RUB]|uniref:Putative transmembrane protein n=1 Tax=Toxoplasma gondii RUB TaxID=935652 RepID=A0A086M9L5_TOXGO|nr:putative transmembrane protein [Toxoplasma gondii RUB]
MEVAHFDSFSSPIRATCALKNEESPSSDGPDLDGHVLEDLDLQHETTRSDHLAPPDAIIEVEPAPEKVPLAKVAQNGSCSPVELTSRTCSCWKVSLSHIVTFLTLCCFVFITATVACRLAIGNSQTEPAVIFIVTCIVAAVGIWGIVARSPGLTIGFACLLVLLTVATIVCGSLEANRFREEFATLEELKRKPALTPEEEQQVKDISESLKILAAFVALYFLCAALVLVTCILTFKLHRTLAENEGGRKVDVARGTCAETYEAKPTEAMSRNQENDGRGATALSADAQIPLTPAPAVGPEATNDEAEGEQVSEN